MTCYLDVSSVPTEASVYINNNYVGETFLNDYIIQTGVYQILIRKSGFEDWTTTLTIHPDDLVRWLRATLNPTGQLPGAIQFLSTPSGADVEMNNQPYGVTPVLVSDLSAGRYFWIFRLEGYNLVSGDAIVYENQTTTIDRNLSPEEPTPPPEPPIVNYLPLILGSAGALVLLSALTPKD